MASCRNLRSLQGTYEIPEGNLKVFEAISLSALKGKIIKAMYDILEEFN